MINVIFLIILLLGFQLSHGMHGDGRKKAITLFFSKVVGFKHQETDAYTYYQAIIRNGDYSVNAIRFPDETYACYGFFENQNNGKQKVPLNMADGVVFNTLQDLYGKWKDSDARSADNNNILADKLQTIYEQCEGDNDKKLDVTEITQLTDSSW